MDKVSAIKSAEILRDAGNAIRSLAAQRDKLAAKCAAYERHAEATKVASAMHDKGIETDSSLGELVERLEKEAAAGRLSEISRAVDMIGPNMSFGRTVNHDEVGGQGADLLTSYLMGTVG